MVATNAAQFKEKRIQIIMTKKKEQREKVTRKITIPANSQGANSAVIAHTRG